MSPEQCLDCEPQSQDAAALSVAAPSNRHITIEYCHRCRFFFRASWVQTELWQTFPPPEIAAITLIPHASDESGSAGIFRITLDGTRVWDRKEMGGFPEMRALKQVIRDIIRPGASLGHSDKPVNKPKPDASADPDAGTDADKAQAT